MNLRILTVYEKNGSKPELTDEDWAAIVEIVVNALAETDYQDRVCVSDDD